MLRPAIEGLACGLGLGGECDSLAYSHDVPFPMGAVNACAMSSAWEGMPNVLLETSATSLPVVATDVGGNREVAFHEKTEFLAPPKDLHALAQAMLHLMSLPQEERKHMGERARRYVEENFSLERVVDRWERLYREHLLKKSVL